MKHVVLFWVFFKVGAFCFGGGMVMLPVIFQSIEEFGIMTVDEFSNLIALSQVTPGPIAVNAATYVGLGYGGLLGGIIATLGVSIPSYLVVIIAMHFLDKWRENQIMQGMISGIRPATVGLIGTAAIFIAETVLIDNGFLFSKLFKNPMKYVNIVPVIMCVITIILTGKMKVNPMIVILIMAVAGGLLCG